MYIYIYHDYVFLLSIYYQHGVYERYPITFSSTVSTPRAKKCQSEKRQNLNRRWASKRPGALPRDDEALSPGRRGLSLGDVSGINTKNVHSCEFHVGSLF